jgi:Fic family protein
VKIERLFKSNLVPISDTNGNFFRVNTEKYAEFLHIIDKEMAGNYMGVDNFTKSDQKNFISRNLMEESILSSKLEGANTSRKAAHKMLKEGRRPSNYSEKMIVNNHKAMALIESDLKNESLSLDMIFRLHKIITTDTIDDNKQSVFRETFDDNGDRLKVIPLDQEKIAYIVPDKEFVKEKIHLLIAFANDDLDTEHFIHPIIKAIILHFWIGLLHPFEDGNGRLARVLFYWYLLKKDYWAFSYLSLSEKIYQSPKQYAWSYIYSEQDDNDLTYFIDYNINKIKLARESFKEYVRKRQEENYDNLHLIQNHQQLNERQIKLLKYLSSDQQKYTSVSEHQNVFDIKRATAASDLRKLFESGYLTKSRRGKYVYYLPTTKIKELFIIKK